MATLNLKIRLHRFFPDNTQDKRSSQRLRVMKPKKIDSSLNYIGTRVYLYDRILINDGRCVSRARCSANTCFSQEVIHRFYTLFSGRCLWWFIGPFSMWNHIFSYEFAWKNSLHCQVFVFLRMERTYFPSQNTEHFR